MDHLVIFDPSGFRSTSRNEDSIIGIPTYDKLLSVDTFMEETQPVVMVEKFYNCTGDCYIRGFRGLFSNLLTTNYCIFSCSSFSFFRSRLRSWTLSCLQKLFLEVSCSRQSFTRPIFQRLLLS